MRLLLALLLAVPPVRAEETPRAAETRLVAEYASLARAQLGQARGFLESLQEFFITPHGADEPVEAALLHLDLAEAYLDEAERAAQRGLEASPEPGWTPFEERVAQARALLKRAAPDLDAVYDRVPILARPLEGDTLALYASGAREVRLRGYFAVNAVPAPYLAALLGHEASHALAAERAEAAGGRYESSLDDELLARRRETAVWRALGGGLAQDFGGIETAQAKAEDAGKKALRGFVEASAAAQREWTWVTPAA
ncbi:MAG: hypothetical protein KGL53_14025, partial [Elusimicrobia bacterium]|nr:hypothetical protein [Elusimicrobiota bacterium]